jgi:replicative DNA helicase
MDLEQSKAKFAHPGNEAAVLACVLKDPSSYFEVEAKLTDTDFLTPHHRALWTVIKSLTRQDIITFDASTLLNQAITLDLEKKISGPNVSAYDYIVALMDKNIEPANIGFYLTRMLDASIKLKVLQATAEIAETTEQNRTLTGETLDAKTIVDDAQNKFLQLALETMHEADAVNLAEGVAEMLAEIQAAPTGMVGIPTGFRRLDTAIGGLEPGTLTVVGARPKTGKSTLLLNWAKHIAYEYKQPVLYVDTEMSGREQRLRLLSTLSSVPEREIKTGTYFQDPQNVDSIQHAQDVMGNGLILHKYYPNFTPEGIAALTRKYHHQGKAMVLFFDYIKLPDADLQMISNVKEYQALGYLTVALKNLAGQLQIPVVTAVQLNREGANKGHVDSANFADSDRILRYANTLLGLASKPKKELQELEEKFGHERFIRSGTHRLQILDTRAGGTNYSGIDLYFRKSTLTMYEAEEQLSSESRSEEDNDES